MRKDLREYTVCAHYCAQCTRSRTEVGRWRLADKLISCGWWTQYNNIHLLRSRRWHSKEILTIRVLRVGFFSESRRIGFDSLGIWCTHKRRWIVINAANYISQLTAMRRINLYQTSTSDCIHSVSPIGKLLLMTVELAAVKERTASVLCYFVTLSEWTMHYYYFHIIITIITITPIWPPDICRRFCFCGFLTLNF